MPSYVTPKKNTEYIFYISLVSQADTKIFQANPTIAAGDFKVATDDGSPANPGTIPAVDGDFTKRVKVTLSTSEMNGDNITFICSDAAGSEWCDLTVNLQTTAEQIDSVLETVIPVNPTAMSANDMILRAGTAQTSKMTINETSGAFSHKEVDDEATEETYGNSKAASGTITSTSGVTTRDPTN